MTKEMYEDLLERARLQISELDTLTEEQDKHICKLIEENAELIKENEEMKKGLGCETCEIHLEFVKLNQKITELEAQIDELKSNSSYVAYIERGHKIYKLEKENEELKERADKADLDSALFFNQLCKAKKIVGNLYAICRDNHYLDGSVLMKQAEQFLEETNE